MVGWHHQLDGCGFGWTPGLIMDREAWRAAVHGVTKSRTPLSDEQQQQASAWSGDALFRPWTYRAPANLWA